MVSMLLSRRHSPHRHRVAVGTQAKLPFAAFLNRDALPLLAISRMIAE
jgi:hypothetical protein